MKKIATLALLCTVVSAPALAQDSKAISGKYCEKFINIVEAVKSPSGSCEPPAYIRESDELCVQKVDADDFLQLQEKEDGTLDFAFSLWYPPYSHYCGIAGNAQATASGWIFQENMSAGSDIERCILNFEHANGKVSITSDIDATCKTMCGFHANPQYIRFPDSLKKSDTPDEQAFNQEYYMMLPNHGGPSCNEKAKEFPNETLVEKYVPASDLVKYDEQ